MQRTGRRATSRSAAAAATSRGDEIAAIYAHCDHDLRRYVASCTRSDPQTLQDACSYARAQLLSHPDVDVRAAPANVLRWLTRTATREAWRLHQWRRLHQRRRLPAGADIDAYVDD
jgi:hypothetical protein